MNSALFEQRLRYHFGHTPTTGQERLFYAFTRFMFSEKNRLCLLIKGYAGTGKTTCVSAMVNTLHELGNNVVLLAPTGRAAKVLSNYSGKTAWTIHRQIYLRRANKSGQQWFELKGNDLQNTVFFVDEASMIASDKAVTSEEDLSMGDLLEDLITYVYSGEGCRLVLIGDGAQLPPVGSNESPALNLDYLQKNYNLNIAELELSEVIRQQEGSGILENATHIRHLIHEGEAIFPTVKTKGFNDVHRIEGDIQPPIEEAMAREGIDDMIIITRSNKRANLFNQQMRQRVLWHEEEINSGDRMMVVKNNYHWIDEKSNHSSGFIANGDIIKIERVRQFIEKGSFRFCKAVISLIDFPEYPEMEVMLLCDTIWLETAGLSYSRMKELWDEVAKDYDDITSLSKLREAIKKDPFYNALHVKFAYAITCHKSQGGQWPTVFVDQGYLADEMLGVELNRWFYTAFTRASRDLYLIGFDDRLIHEE